MDVMKGILILMAMTSLTACTGDVIGKDATEPSKAQVMELVREKQRVIRYNCAGQVTSDKIEQVGSPQNLVEIHPQRDDWSYEKIQSSDFYNETTGSYPGLVISHVKFTIDYDNYFFHMQVASGINKLNYTFEFTDGAIETGSRYINVNYSLKILDGFSEFHPSVEECKPPVP